MALIKRHMSVNIEGLLRHHKNKKITFFEHDDGKRMTDREARTEIQKRLAKGHKLICTSSECEGFDPFEDGCPGHPMEEEVQP